MNKVDIEKVISEFVIDYSKKLNKKIIVEDTAKAYLFSYLVKKLKKEYVILTNFSVGDRVKHDIVILSNSEFKSEDLKTANLFAIIELKYKLSSSKDNVIKFKEDADRMRDRTAKHKYFISLDCDEKLVNEVKWRFDKHCTMAHFVNSN